MSDLDKTITYNEQQMTVREVFKMALSYALVHEPPKRLLGDSDWLGLLHGQLALVDAIPGGVGPCCEKFCDGNKPCHINAKASSRNCGKALLKLIDQI